GLGAFIYKEASQEETSGALTVTALDVGQGDALLIDFPDGKVALLDGGGFVTNLPDTGKRVVLPVLRARGIEFLDLVILSHPHPVHLLVLLRFVEQVAISDHWFPALPATENGLLREHAPCTREKGAHVRTAFKLYGSL